MESGSNSTFWEWIIAWSKSNNLFIPVWFQESATPDARFLEECIDTDSDKNIIVGGEADPDLEDEERVASDEAWSVDSDSQEDEGFE